MSIANKVQLITYPDSLGQNLAELHHVVKRYLSKAIACYDEASKRMTEISF